jgi:hypothetical protein
MYCTSLLAGLVTIATVAVPQSGPAVAENPFVGNWTANLVKSRLDPNYQFQSVTLRVAVAGDTVTMASELVNAAGQNQQAAETFRTDGTETPGTLNPGVILVARWVGSHVLATIARKDGRMFGLVTYEVSDDGKTLTVRSSGAVEHVIVFDRQ